MTQCFKGGYAHDFPIEDECGCYCEEHGVELQRARVDLSQPPHPLLAGAALEAAAVAGRPGPEPSTGER
ncbi:hypothetical protein [Streptomyces sp. 8L]|uniref:hypothetical protein n=1 Tax=Streptomyces sp. 8L TaxID=2877242 RepID=UPI001CD34313|nr:hypothetical protein [Streptomyces sp. 8L]MCA1220688.1 hypothetical protein [Streptomyces sp. 8L]